ASATVSLTIRPKVTVTADNKPITYGDPEPVFTYTTSPTTSLSSITCGVAGAHTTAGTYTITCSQPNGANPSYAVVFVNGTLTIGKANQAALTVTSPNAGTFGDHLAMAATGGSTAATPTFTVDAGSTACSILTALDPDAGK